MRCCFVIKNIICNKIRQLLHSLIYPNQKNLITPLKYFFLSKTVVINNNHISVLPIMNLTIHNHLLSKQFLSNMAYNSTHNILAAIVDATDTIAFYHFHPQHHTIQQIFQGTSKPSGKKTSLAWSHDGQYLALGSGQLELWKFDGKKLIPLKNYNEDFIDIKIIAWSPDSFSIAYGGLCKKNTIKIRQLQTGTVQQIIIPLAISSISYDPFGKYLILLVRNNIISIYNSNSLAKIKEVALSPKAAPFDNINTVKEMRNMGWSPDFNYLVCPSLDDSKISLAVNLCRSTNFKVHNVFMGHVSSISCAKFNPNLYEFQGQSTSILALGDSHGVVSFWRVGNKLYDKPLLICNSDADSHQVVEELEWNQNGDILLVNMMKRYINIVTVDKTCFGKQISIAQKANLIESSYGVRSASQISNKQLQIFSIADLKIRQTTPTPNLDTNPVQQKPVPITNNVPSKPNPVTFQPIAVQESFGQSRLGDKVQYVKVNEQITIKDKNNRKKIQPAMMMLKEDVAKAVSSSNALNTVNPLGILPSAINLMNCFEPLKLKPIQADIRIYRIGKNGYMELKKVQGFSIVQLLQTKQFQKVLINEKVLTGSIDFVKALQNKIYILNAGNLYIFDSYMNMTELPYSLGDIHKISINEYGDIYYISTKGIIRGFNHTINKCYTPAALPIQVLLQNIKQQTKGTDQPPISLQEKDDQFQKVIDEFIVEKDHNLYVTLSHSQDRYFYSKETGCWVNLQFSQGLIKNGHSLRVSQHEQKLMSDFFRSITAKLINQTPTTQSSSQYNANQIQLFQSNMIYYRRHNPNKQLYKQSLLGLIKELKLKNQTTKLRNILRKYIVDQSSQFYENDLSLKTKVKSIGGSVIQEFILFGVL